ncbi:MAG: PAS domain S-box protein, partial [Cyanobacteria bacterium Co-bin13]|nr:PAS domain S-box protein [Cyanobacteria bacterium Co-bin13]
VRTQDFYANPQDREDLVVALQRHGGVHDFEVQLLRRDGSLIWGLLSLRMNAAEDCLEFVITDISDRKRVEEDRQWAEAALRQREAEYRLLVETANSVILKWDTQGTVLYLNDYGQKFFGYDLEEIVGRSVVDTIVPETETTGRDLEDLMVNLCQHPERYMFNENENRCKDGRRVWIAWANKPIYNEQEQLVGILSVGADVTERRRLEETLRQSQQFLNRIVENIPLTIFTKNIQAGFRYELINQNCERILGFTRQEGMGKTDYDLLPQHLADHYRAQDLAVVAQGTAVETSEEVILPRSGEKVFLRSVKLPLSDSQGNPSYLLGISEDFTERQQREEALRLIVEGTASATGEEFFRTCVSYLARVLRVRYAFIAQFTTAGQAQTLAYWADGAIAENFDYTIAGTPCAEMVPGQLLSYPQQVKTHFPRSPRLQSMTAESYLGAPLLDTAGQMLGHLAVLDDRPMSDDAGRELILRIFAARAGAELKRMQAEKELRESEERFRTLIANLPGAAYRCHDDENWTLTFLSESFEQITGYPVSDFIHNQARNINDISLADAAQVKATIQTALAERQP